MALKSIKEIIGMIGHPKGSILYTTSNVNPSQYIGGTWIKIENCFLSAMNPFEEYEEWYVKPTYTNTTNGGSPNAINVTHSHTGVAHSHTPSSGSNYGFLVYQASQGATRRKTRPATGSDEMYVHTTPQGSAAGLGFIGSWAAYTGECAAPSGAVAGTGKNMPLYKTVYIWLRTEW